MRPNPRLPLALLALVLPAALAAQTPASDEPLSVTLRPAFQVQVGFAHVGWSGVPLSGAYGPALTVSRRVAGPVRGVIDFATFSGTAPAGPGSEAARHYVVNAALAVAPELSAGGHLVEPEVGIGIGTVVTAPAATASSSTRSQNAWELIAGLEAGVYGPFTLGLRYRRVRVHLQDVAAPGPSIPSVPASAHVFEVSLGVRF